MTLRLLSTVAAKWHEFFEVIQGITWNLHSISGKFLNGFHIFKDFDLNITPKFVPTNKICIFWLWLWTVLNDVGERKFKVIWIREQKNWVKAKQANKFSMRKLQLIRFDSVRFVPKELIYERSFQIRNLAL